MLLLLYETAVARVVQHWLGTFGSGQGQSTIVVVFERIARRESHSHLTLAAVCSDAGLQARVPQWMLPRHAALSRAARMRLAELRPPLFWLRGMHGWVTSNSL